MMDYLLHLKKLPPYLLTKQLLKQDAATANVFYFVVDIYCTYHDLELFKPLLMEVFGLDILLFKHFKYLRKSVNPCLLNIV